MKIRHLRAKWTLGTTLLVVTWSPVMVWLNVRPRTVGSIFGTIPLYGWPWTYAIQFSADPNVPPGFSTDSIYRYWPFAANTAIGLLAVAVLTFASKYLLRAITAALRAFMSKPPPANNGSSQEA